MECIKYAYKILTEYSLEVPIPQFLFVLGGGDGGSIPFSCQKYAVLYPFESQLILAFESGYENQQKYSVSLAVDGS